MNASVPSIYSQSGGIRQCRSVQGRVALRRIALVCWTALALTGCSAISIPLGDAAGTSDVNAPIDLTGNISDTSELDVGPGDRLHVPSVLQWRR